MITYIYYEPSEFRSAILAHPQRCSVATPLLSVPYGSANPVIALHRQNYTAADAQVVCDWLNRRVEYLNTLRFPSPASLGTELGSEAALTAIPPGGERGMSSASICDADALVEPEIVLTERELLEAALLTGRESY
jgi:hypothetical protein